MAELTEILRDRSHRQEEMTALMLKIKAEDVRYIAVETLGKTNEKEAGIEANKYLTKSKPDDIIAALLEVERIKGKKYTGDLAYAGIPETLYQGGISQAELPEWLKSCKETTYCSGHRYQPLPSHDEAWQTYSKVHSEIMSKRFAAETIKYKTPAVKLLDTEIIQAAEWGFWDDMSKNLKRRLFLLLPVDRQKSIRASNLQPEEAMKETRSYFDKMQEVFT